MTILRAELAAVQRHMLDIQAEARAHKRSLVALARMQEQVA